MRLLFTYAVHSIKAEIIKPENDADFEEMCANVYGVVFNDSSPKCNGRRGQKQAGVDVFVEANNGRIGIQSKRYRDGRLTFKHIKDEVAAADEGKAPIVKLIIATTAVNDAPLLRQVQTLSDERIAAGLFPVEVDFWGEICAHIERHNELQDHYSPNAAGALFHRVENKQDEIYASCQQLQTQIHQLQSSLEDTALPAGRNDSVNRVLSSQLDSVSTLINKSRYREAEDRLELIARDFSNLDQHQKARWHILRGVCRTHLHSGAGAADDFLVAAKLYPADEKMAAAKIRGLTTLGKIDEAMGAGATALAEFPASLHVWRAIAHAKLTSQISITEADVPPGSMDEPETLQILCWAALQRGDPAAAVNYARRAVANPAAGYFARAALLSAALTQASNQPVARTYNLFDQNILDTLAEATRQFEPRAEKLWTNQSRALLPDDATNLAYAYLLLSQPAIAMQVLDESAAQFEMTPRMISVKLETLRELDRTADFLNLTKDRVDIIEPEAFVVIAETAALAGDIDLIDMVIARLSAGLSEEESETIRSLRWVALFKSGKKDEAVRAIEAAKLGDEHFLSVVMTATHVLLSAGLKADATVHLDRLAACIPINASIGQKLMLADLMFFAGRYAEAAKLYAPYTPPGKHSALHKKLLRCYIRSGQRRRAKEFLDTFPANWSTDDETRNLAMELAHVAGDWNRLLPLAKQEVERLPRHAGSWHLLLAIEVRHSAATDFIEILSRVPEDLEGSVRQVIQIAGLELRYRKYEKGLMRLYRLFRRNLEDLEVASGYMMLILTGPPDLPCMEQDLPAVCAGSSCSLEDIKTGQRVHVTIDPIAAGDLPKTTEFVGHQDQMALSLIGKSIGDEATITATFGVQRRFKIVTITTAFRRLLDITQERAHTPFGGLPNILSMQVIRKDGELDLEEIQAMLKKSTDRKKFMLDTYEQNPMTIGMLAEALNISPLELVIGWPQEGPAMRVCRGDAIERTTALAAVREAGVMVIDLATLGEIVALDCEASLAAVCKVYISASSEQALKALRKDDVGNERSAKAVEVAGRVQIHEIPEEYRRQQTEFLQRLQDAIDKYCEVCPAYGAEDIPAAFAELEDKIGEEEYHALLLAHERGAVLLSLDLNIRAIAKVMLGVDGIWPQVLFMDALDKHLIDGNAYSNAVGTMFLNNRSHISVNGLNVLWMCQQGERTLQETFAKLKADFSEPTADFAAAMRVVNQFIAHLIRLGPQVGVVLEIVEYLYEALFRHPKCPSNFLQISQLYALEIAKNVEIPDEAYTVIGHSDIAIRRTMLDLLMRRIRLALDRAAQPIDSRPIMLTVIKATQEPSIVLRPEILNKDDMLDDDERVTGIR